ncbi:MAG: hypothetical protein Q8936_06210 [Bacillota bacterium]|nr:hypothetical protein [Bacillota bacterium]
MRSIKSTLMIGSICGIIISCINTSLIILSLYTNLNISVYYGMAIISALVAFLFFINHKAVNILLSFLISVVTFIITEIITGQVGIVNMVFKHIYGASAEMWAGDGFGMMVVTLFNITGYFLGFVLALIIPVFKKMIRLF